MTTVRICHSVEELVEELADDLIHALRGARRSGRDLVVALSGGSTPRPFYEHLASHRSDDVAWHHMQVVLVDERDVPIEDRESNLGMIRRLWLDRIGLPERRIHAPRWGAGDLDGVARDYEVTLRRLAGDPARIDWMLLGLGTDGHTASLFPYHDALDVTDRDVVGVPDSPKPPPRRLTLTVPAIQRAREVHMLVTGAAKSKAVREAFDPGLSSRHCPAIVLQRASGRVKWWLDDAADGQDGGLPGDD